MPISILSLQQEQKKYDMHKKFCMLHFVKNLTWDKFLLVSFLFKTFSEFFLENVLNKNETSRNLSHVTCLNNFKIFVVKGQNHRHPLLQVKMAYYNQKFQKYSMKELYHVKITILFFPFLIFQKP